MKLLQDVASRRVNLHFKVIQIILIIKLTIIDRKKLQTVELLGIAVIDKQKAKVRRNLFSTKVNPLLPLILS